MAVSVEDSAVVLAAHREGPADVRVVVDAAVAAAGLEAEEDSEAVLPRLSSNSIWCVWTERAARFSGKRPFARSSPIRAIMATTALPHTHQ